MTAKNSKPGQKEAVALRIIKLSPKRITALVPDGLEAGIYALGFTAEYGNTVRRYGDLEVEIYGV